MGQGLARFFQQMIVNLTGIDGKLVRPRWQAEPGNVPDFNVAWCALGITRRETQGFAWENLSSDGSVYKLDRQEELTLLCSFYDNSVDQTADQFAYMVRDGLQLSQNRESFNAVGLGFIGSGALVPLPTLLKQRWQYRVDLPLRFRRQMTWQYQIQSVTSATCVLEVENDNGSLIEQTIQVPVV